jgi:hypothetical protein
MNQRKIDNVTKLSIEDRYDYFIRNVAELEEVWGLYKDSWALLSDDGDEIVFPVWPEKEFAALCCTGKWAEYTPKLIPLIDFMGQWIPKMEKDGVYANVFYVPDNKIGSIIKPDILLNDLKDELEKYGY